MNRVNNGGHPILTLTAQGTAVNSADQKNYGCRGVQVIVDITALAGTTPTLTVTLKGKDRVSGKYYTLLASTALNATGTTVLRVFPGATASANLIANDQVPEDWRIETAIGGSAGQAVTATIAASYLV